MNKIKKPKWDKPSEGTASAGNYTMGAKLPSNSYIDVGMTAYAKFNNTEIKIESPKWNQNMMQSEKY